MVEIIWSDTAVSDLNEIAEYIVLCNPTAAAEVVQKLFEKLERLEKFPTSGKVPLELPTLNYREVVSPPCRVFYRLEKNLVYIVHICRAERDLRKFLITKGVLNP